MRGILMIPKIVRRNYLLNLGSVLCSSSLVYETQVSSSSSYSTNVSSPPPKPSSLNLNDFSTYNSPSNFLFQRSFSSSSSPDSSNVVHIKSEKQFDALMENVKESSLPAIFYFTAAWCGPCRFISPILAEESKKYPNVTTYKIDIDQEELGSVLSRLQISAVPTLHFFREGKKEAEVVGADIQKVKDKMEELYGGV